jgi:hypothetical protein
MGDEKMKRLLVLFSFFLASNAFSQAGDYIKIKKAGDRDVFHSKSLENFWSIGMNTFFTTYDNPDLKNIVVKADRKKLYQEQIKKLSKIGINTLGGWSNLEYLEEKMPYGIVLFDDDLPLAGPLEDKAGNQLEFVNGSSLPMPVRDPYSAEYKAQVEDYIRRAVKPNDPMLLCYWIGNEFKVGDTDALDFSNYIYSSGVSDRFTEFLKTRYQEIEKLNAKWGTAFADFILAAKNADATIATQKTDIHDFQKIFVRDWFVLVRDLIKKYDPNHLVSSPRITAWKETGTQSYFDRPIQLGHFSYFVGLFDLISMNIYSKENAVDPALMNQIRLIHTKLNVPILISEFGTREEIKGWNNKPGAKVLVKSQAERAQRYESQVNQWFAEKYILGVHWFKWQDHNSQVHQFNKGVVTVKGDDIVLYPELTSTMKDVNSKINSQVRKLKN